MWPFKKKKQKTQEVDYIPIDLDDAIIQLIRMMPPKDIQKFKNETEQSIVKYHFGFGMRLRNRWGLWNESRLARWFNEKGITHADDMSGIIFTSLHRRLNDKPIELEKQIKQYQEYWDNYLLGPCCGEQITITFKSSK